MCWRACGSWPRRWRVEAAAAPGPPLPRARRAAFARSELSGRRAPSCAHRPPLLNSGAQPLLCCLSTHQQRARARERHGLRKRRAQQTLLNAERKPPLLPPLRSQSACPSLALDLAHAVLKVGVWIAERGVSSSSRAGGNRRRRRRRRAPCCRARPRPREVARARSGHHHHHHGHRHHDEVPGPYPSARAVQRRGWAGAVVVGRRRP